MNTKKQRELIEYLISSPDTFALCHGVLDYEYFDPELQPSIKFILDYYEEYNATPTASQIDIETDLEVKEVEVKRHELDYAVNEVESFCKQMAMQNAILKGAELLQKGEWNEIEEMVKDAVMVSVNTDLGLEYFDTVEERLERLKQGNERLPTKWIAFNEMLFGGPQRKELLLFAAGSGGGKSISMSNLGLDYADSGYNVLYISLELSQDVVCQRFDNMITRISRKVWRDHIPEIVNGVKNFKNEGTGRLDVVYMPTESKPLDIRAYLKNYQLHHGFMPDVICVDYLDKLAPNARVDGNAFDVDKKISEQLRQIGVDINALIISASQLNRSAVGVDEMDQNHSHIAGGISKINESDTFITIYMSETMRNAGEMIMVFQKTRNSDGVGQRVKMVWDHEALRIIDKGLTNDEIDLEKCNYGIEGHNPSFTENKTGKKILNSVPSGDGDKLNDVMDLFGNK